MQTGRCLMWQSKCPLGSPHPLAESLGSSLSSPPSATVLLLLSQEAADDDGSGSSIPATHVQDLDSVSDPGFGLAQP